MTETPVLSKKAPANYGVPAFEMPKFDMPKFDMSMFDMQKFDLSKLEVPAAFREMAEKSVSQAKEQWEKMRVATEEATDLIESSYTKASKGAADYGLAVIDAARVNANAAFDFYSQLMTAKTVSEVVELATAHARKQFETMTAQGKGLTALAQKVATETTEPIKTGVTTAFKKVA